MKKDLERIVIAQWLHGKNINDMDVFGSEDFSTYRELFRAIREGGFEVEEDGFIDLVALCEKSGVSVSDMSELIAAYSPTMYSSAVNSFFQGRGKAWLQSNLDKPIEEIREHLSKFIGRRISVPEPSSEPVMNMLNELDRRATEKPVLFNLSDLDYFLCGIRPSELTFIAARPSVGKSAFCFQGALNVAKQGKKVLFLALEMSETSIVLRHLLSKVSLSNYQVRNGIAKDTWKHKGQELTTAIEDMQNFYKNGNFLLFDRSGKSESDPADLNVVRELIHIHRPYLVVIDQLEQVKDSGIRFTDKRTRFSHATHTLQEIALQENVAIWCACQVNRDADNKPPTLANLKESGTIEEDATNVIMLHRESEKTDDRQIIQCDVAKQKDGKCGVINLMFDAPRFTFYGAG